MIVLSSCGVEDSPKAEPSDGFATDEARPRQVTPTAEDAPATAATALTSEAVALEQAIEAAKFFHPGKLIKGRYELQAQVGAGGLGAVWSARHLGLNSTVALKFLKPELANHAEAVSRFSAEARACFVLRSEHVVRVLDVDSADGVPFIVMELLDGTDLRHVIGTMEPSAPLSPVTVVDYALQVCEGLSAAHGSGIIHRDVKPENLFLHGVGAEARVKVLDFGISQLQAEYAGAQAPAGTPPYMSPEQLRAAVAVDARSDVWSLGCVLYELLTGIAPFERETAADSCKAVLTLEPAPLSSLRSDLPDGLSAVIERCLQKKPSARFADAEQLAAALVGFGSGKYVDYPARCCTQLRAERRSAIELSAFRDSQPSATVVAPAADSSSEIALLTGTESLPRRLERELRVVANALWSSWTRQTARTKRTLWLSALGASALGVLVLAQAQDAAEPHIVTPSLLAPKLSNAVARPRENAPVPARVESLLPAGASAVLEQGQAAPLDSQDAQDLEQVGAQVNKHKARHMSRSSRYQRRHAQRDPDVGF